MTTTTSPQLEALIKNNYFIHRMTAQSLIALERRTEARIQAAKLLQAILVSKRDVSMYGIGNLTDYGVSDHLSEIDDAEQAIRSSAALSVTKQQELLGTTIESGKIMFEKYGELILKNAYVEDADRFQEQRPLLYLVENNRAE